MSAYLILTAIALVALINAVAKVPALLMRHVNMVRTTCAIDMLVGMSIALMSDTISADIFGSDDFVWMAAAMVIGAGIAMACNELGTAAGRWLFH